MGVVGEGRELVEGVAVRAGSAKRTMGTSQRLLVHRGLGGQNVLGLFGRRPFEVTHM